MSRKGIPVLTQKELAHRWDVCLRTVRKEVRRWGLEPCDYIGLMPLFAEPDVEAAERRRLETRLAQTHATALA